MEWIGWDITDHRLMVNLWRRRARTHLNATQARGEPLAEGGLNQQSRVRARSTSSAVGCRLGAVLRQIRVKTAYFGIFRLKLHFFRLKQRQLLVFRLDDGIFG